MTIRPPRVRREESVLSLGGRNCLAPSGRHGLDRRGLARAEHSEDASNVISSSIPLKVEMSRAGHRDDFAVVPCDFSGVARSEPYRRSALKIGSGTLKEPHSFQELCEHGERQQNGPVRTLPRSHVPGKPRPDGHGNSRPTPRSVRILAAAIAKASPAAVAEIDHPGAKAPTVFTYGVGMTREEPGRAPRSRSGPRLPWPGADAYTVAPRESGRRMESSDQNRLSARAGKEDRDPGGTALRTS